MAVQLQTRTAVDGKSPVAGSLQPGQLAVEMGTPTRLWVGVPVAQDAAMQKKLYDSATELTPPVGPGAFGLLETTAWTSVLPLSGGTMTGALDFADNIGITATTNFSIKGSTNASGDGCFIDIYGGAAAAGSGTYGGGIGIIAGAGDGATGNGGNVNIAAGLGGDSAGTIILTAGAASAGPGGDVRVNGGAGTTAGGNIELFAGRALAPGSKGGNISLTPGESTPAGNPGNILMQLLPTVAQAAGTENVWNNNGALNIGAGAPAVDLSAYLPLAGGTLTGGIYVGTPPVTGPYVWVGPETPMATVYLNSNTAIGGSTAVVFAMSEIPRWWFMSNDEPESGANAGSNLELRRFDDLGSGFGPVFTVRRATGVVDFGVPPTVAGAPLPFLPLTGGTMGATALIDAVAAPTAVGHLTNKQYVDNLLAQLTGVVIFAGTYDATTSTGTYNGQGGITAGSGALPAPAAANGGAYVIVTVAGPGGAAGEPAGPLAVGDWILSDSTAWNRLAFNQNASAYLPLSGGVVTGPINMAAGSTGVNLLAGTDLYVMGAANGANFVAPTQVNTAFGTWATQNIGFGIDDTVTPPRLRWKANGIDLGVIASGVVGDYLPLTGGTVTGDVNIVGASLATPAYLTLINGVLRGGYNATGLPVGLDLRGATGTAASAYGGVVRIFGGDADQTVPGAGGYVGIQGGVGGSGTSLGGGVTVEAGMGGYPDGVGGKTILRGGPSQGLGAGGEVEVRGGTGIGAGRGGDVLIGPGRSQGGGGFGLVRIGDLPTVTQTDISAVWNNNGVLNIGAGTVGSLADYLPLVGGTLTGRLTINSGLTVSAPSATTGNGLEGIYLTASSTDDLTAIGAGVGLYAGRGGEGGRITINAGESLNDLDDGGNISLTAGKGSLTRDGGDVLIIGGQSGAGTGADGGHVVLQGGTSQSTFGGPVELHGGGSTSGTGGDIEIEPGNGPAGVGNFYVRRLPTTLPAITDIVWNNGGWMCIGNVAPVMDGGVY